MFNLQKNGVHNLILEEIKELVSKHRNVEKIIRWVLAKNKLMFEDLFFQKDDDSEDADTTDTQSESNEAESDASDFESEDNTSGTDQDGNNNTSQSDEESSF